MEILFGIRHGFDRGFPVSSARTFVAGLALALTFTGCADPVEDLETGPVRLSILPDAVIAEALRWHVDFNKHVRPILEHNCMACEDGTQMALGCMDLTNREAMLNHHPLGPRIFPGAPDKSLLIKNLAQPHAPLRTMPPSGTRLPEDGKKILRNWITAAVFFVTLASSPRPDP